MQQKNFKDPSLDRVEETGLSLLTKKWLSSDQVCKILGISSRTLQNYRDQRLLPFSQPIGKRKIYYKAADIQEYLESYYVKANYQEGGAL
jgi:predicted DNA-binding transcriptional regulator AlpA